MIYSIVANSFQTNFWIDFPEKSGVFEPKMVSKNIQSGQGAVAKNTFCLKLGQNSMAYTATTSKL